MPPAVTPGGPLGVDRSWVGLFQPFPCSPAATAFPILMQGRRTHWTFRGLLDVHSRYGLPVRRTASRYVCLEGSDGFVTSAAAPIATGWSDPDARRDSHPLKIPDFSRRTLACVPASIQRESSHEHTSEAFRCLFLAPASPVASASAQPERPLPQSVVGSVLAEVPYTVLLSMPSVQEELKLLPDQHAKMAEIRADRQATRNGLAMAILENSRKASGERARPWMQS